MGPLIDVQFGYRDLHARKIFASFTHRISHAVAFDVGGTTIALFTGARVLRMHRRFYDGGKTIDDSVELGVENVALLRLADFAALHLSDVPNAAEIARQISIVPRGCANVN